MSIVYDAFQRSLPNTQHPRQPNQQAQDSLMKQKTKIFSSLWWLSTKTQNNLVHCYGFLVLRMLN